MSHQIKKTIELKASIEKVWEALTDYKKFGEWFQVELESPFVVGEATQGVSTHPECQMKWYAIVKEIKPMTLFLMFGPKTSHEMRAVLHGWSFAWKKAKRVRV